MSTSIYQDHQARREALVELLKDATKAEVKRQRAAGQVVQLSALLDAAAKNLEYRNWSLLHKDVMRMTDDKFGKFEDLVSSIPEIQEYRVRTPALKDAAISAMRKFVEANFSPLSHYAFHDSESETGYAAPEVELIHELDDEFGHLYPHELLLEVAQDLELDQGPWGRESDVYGDD